ncbi:MAG: P-II family nitrogen regulator [Christensenellaceae bacterium]|nr:P-II family nitrogen regulator [Christensenellaceae bacterium]
MIKYDLIIIIVNRGFADEVMTAAKSAGAFGGTVMNARGTGTNEQQKFFGALIQPEKELVMILTEREKRNAMMEAISRDAGLSKEGMGICFSLPVDGVAGIRSFREKETNEISKQ